MTDEREFDRMLEDVLSMEPLSDNSAAAVTPWKAAMERIVLGIGLTSITLNFLYLQYLLPTLGIVCLWLGTRTLRRENGWFTAAWVISVVKLAAQFVNLVLLAVPGQDALWLAYVLLPVGIFQTFCLWRGIKAVRRAAEQPGDAGAAGALVVLQAIVAALAVMEVSGWLFGLPVLAAYVLILYALSKVPALLDGAGYTVTAAPVRVSDGVAKWVYVGVLLVCIVGALLAFGRVPMDWTPTRSETPTETAAGQHLLDLGFPETVLRDLTAQDLDGLDEALTVYTKTNSCYYENTGYGTEYHIDYDPNYDTEQTQLVFTHAAVELPDGRWKVFHHFEWVELPKVRKTECMQFWPASHVSDNGYGYDWEGEAAGRVLYDRDGTTYESPYHTLEFQSYTYSSWWGGTNTQQDLFASFSLPRKGEDCRGYVAYTVREKNDVMTLFDSWNNYTRQTRWFQYPAQTALDNAKSGTWNYKGAFRTVQVALQFYPGEGLLN